MSKSRAAASHRPLQHQAGSRRCRQAVPTDPVRGRAADARAGRPEDAAPSSYQGKDLHIPTPRRCRSPGRCYAPPQTYTRRPGSLWETDRERMRKSPPAITDLPCFKFQTGLKMAGKPPTGWALPFPVAVLRSMSSRHAGRGKSGLLQESKRSVQATPSRVRGTVHLDDQRSHFPL